MLTKANLSFKQIADFAEVRIDFVNFINDQRTTWSHPDTWTEDEWEYNLGERYLKMK